MPETGVRELRLLELEEVVKHFRPRRRGGATVHAVDGVSFSVAAGETFGLVGESGCLAGGHPLPPQTKRPPQGAFFNPR